jgi:hypothetical protein
MNIHAYKTSNIAPSTHSSLIREFIIGSIGKCRLDFIDSSSAEINSWFSIYQFSYRLIFSRKVL